MDIKNPGKLIIWLLKLESHIKTKRYRDFCDKLRLRGNESVLEFGCVWGRNTIELAQRLPRGILTCIDISAVWIEFTKKRLQDRFKNVELICGDIRGISCDIGSMDAIVIHHVLHDIAVEERLPTMQALMSWLKAGGKVYIKEPSKPGHGMSLEEIDDIITQCGLITVEKQIKRKFNFAVYCEDSLIGSNQTK